MISLYYTSHFINKKECHLKYKQLSNGSESELKFHILDYHIEFRLF